MKVLLSIAVILVLLLGLALSLPFLIDLNAYQDRYRPLIEEALNRKITLQDIRLTIWPRIGARVGGFTVQDDPSFRSGPFASLSSLDIGVKLLPLLSGKIEVEEISLRDPVIVILKSKTGVLNISTLGSRAPAATKPEAPAAEPAPGPLRALALLAVDRVSIDGGKLTYRDESAPHPVEYAVHDLEFLLTSVHLGDTASLRMAAAVQPYNLPVTLQGSLGPLTETFDVKHFEFDMGLGRVPISAKGGAIGGIVDMTVSAPLISSADLPIALPFTKPVQVKNLHVTAHLDYGRTANVPFSEALEIADLGLAIAMGNSLVNLKGRAAGGVAHITAASSDLSSDDAPIDLPLIKPVTVKNLHLSARAAYPPKHPASPLEWADIPDFGAVVVMGRSIADIKGSLNGGIGRATITSKGLSTADLPVAVPLKAPVEISGVRAAVEIRSQELRVSTLVFEAFDGSVKGHGSMGLGSPTPPFHADLVAEGLQLQPLSEVAGLSPLSMSGTAATALSLKGRGFRNPQLAKTLEGTGSIAVRNGAFEGVSLMQQAATLLKIAGLSPEEVKATVFSAMNGAFTVRNGLITVQQLAMESHDFRATGNGTIGLDTTVQLRLNLDLSQSLSRRIASSSPLAKMALSGGRLSVPLIITGTLQSPSYGLDTKLFAGRVQEQAKRKAKETVEDLLEGRTTPEDLRQQGESLLKGLFRR